MSKFYRFLSSPKIRFLDDILTELEKEPSEQSEDDLAPKVCFDYSKPDEIFEPFRITKPFIPINKERLYFRVATLYLEREKLISIIRVNPYIPTYLINYEGIVLVRSGGLGRKLILEKLSGRLQRTAWIAAFLALVFKILIDLNIIQPFKSTNDLETKYPNEIQHTPKKTTEKTKSEVQKEKSKDSLLDSL